jgi:hypothetical protein
MLKKNPPRDNSHICYSVTNIQKNLEILKKYKDKRLSKVSDVKSLLEILSSSKKDIENDGIQKIYDCCGSDLKKNFFDILNFMIDSILQDNGNLLLNIEPLKQGISGFRVYSKYQAFLAICYIFLHFTPQFFTLYSKTFLSNKPSDLQKVLCIFNYISQIKRIIDEGKLPYLEDNSIIIIRQVSLEFDSLQDSENFLLELSNASSSCLKEVNCLLEESLYDIGKGCIEADFANRYVGGGILTWGDVQEEIKFSINPELIISMCICEFMKENEAIYIIGTEQFSQFKGYGFTFQFHQNCFNYGELNNIKNILYGGKSLKIVDSVLLAFDAKKYMKFEENFLKENYLRELRKAYTAFRPLENDSDNYFNSKAIATGKWGCGVYKGDSELKFLIQYMVCSYFKRPMTFTCFKDKPLYNKIIKFIEFLRQKDLKLISIIGTIDNIIKMNEIPEKFSIISFIIDSLL